MLGRETTHRMRHGCDQSEQRDCERGHDQPLYSTESLWCQKLSQSALQHSRPKKRRLEVWRTTAGFSHSEEQLSVRMGVAEGADDACVAIHLDGERESPQLPPEREIPRSDHERQ